MSGDVQPRKRKEKRRKKEDSEEIASNFSSDEHIHVHKDASTGGNICAKILFFLLSFVLLVMVGLVLFEYRGFSDDEALIPVSKWAPTFDGWLDDTAAKHDEHEEVSDSGEHGPAENLEQSGETKAKQEKTVGIPEESNEVESGEDEEDLKKQAPKKEVNEETQHLGDSAPVSVEKMTKVHKQKQEKITAPAGQHSAVHDKVTGKTVDMIQEPKVGSSSTQAPKLSSSADTHSKAHEELKDAPVQQLKKQPVDTELPKARNTIIDETENSQSKTVRPQDQDSKMKKIEDDNKIKDTHKPAQHTRSDKKERDEPHSIVKESSANQQDAKTRKQDIKFEQGKELKKKSEKLASESGKKVVPAPEREKKEGINLKEDKRHGESENHVSQSKNSGPTAPEKEKENKHSEQNRKYDEQKQVKQDSKTKTVESENSIGTATVGERKISEKLKDGKRPELKKSSDSHASQSENNGPTAPGEEKVSKNSKGVLRETKKIDTSDSAKSSQFQQKGDTGSEIKIEHTTSKLVGKQNSNNAKEESKAKDSPTSEQLQMKGSESTPPKAKTQKPADGVDQKQMDKEMKTVKKPDKIKTGKQKQTDLNIDSQVPSKAPSHATKKSEAAKKLDEGKRETPSQKVGDGIKNERTSESMVAEEEEDEPEPSGVSKMRQPERGSEDSGSEKEVPITKSKITKNMGGQSSQVYSKSDITNEDEWNIIQELDAADNDAEEKPEIAIHQYDTILRSYPNSPRAWYGKATALDHLAAKKQSNFILDQAIDAYKKVISGLKNVPDKLFLLAAERCIDRMRFRGVHGKAVQIHKLLMERFPNKPDYQNQLAVTYLMINRIPEAKKVLEDVLQKWPKNGFAQAHYGFILKTGNYNMTEAVRYLQEGIASREPGTIDGRFFFQLGDALMRLGRRKEAMEVNELGVKEGLFLSKYQRSLYNVDKLHAQPWWSPEETTYASNFRKLEENWVVIKNEGVKALYDTTKNLFKDEAENLRDSGKWKQLELFARGRKIPSNCAKVPVTCKLIEEFPAARDCRRGQVKFSVMDPGTHVWPHCGPTNCRLRAHLGLVVPENTYIRVAEETRSWKEGKLFIFDDSFEHEVWHNGTSTRLVLIIDVWHPELTAEERRTLAAI